jgi:hypothetical protein
LLEVGDKGEQDELQSILSSPSKSKRSPAKKQPAEISKLLVSEKGEALAHKYAENRIYATGLSADFLKTTQHFELDSKALHRLSPLVKQMEEGFDEISIVRNPNFPEVFECKNECGETIGRLKLGAYRADLETTLRHMASSLNLEESIAPGLIYPIRWGDVQGDLSPDEEGVFAAMDLYNSNKLLLVIEDEAELDGTTVGILEPEIKSSTSLDQASTISYAKMLLLSLALGIRDLDEKNILVDQEGNCVIVDAEECMPKRVEPLIKEVEIAERLEKKVIPSLHLPFLADSNSVKPLNKEEIETLKALVLTWNIPQTVQEAKTRPIMHADTAIESREVTLEGEEEEIEGAKFIIDPSSKEEAVFALEEKAQNSEFLFVDSEISAFEIRLNRIKEAVLSLHVGENLKKIVYHTDPYYGQLDQEIDEMLQQIYDFEKALKQVDPAANIQQFCQDFPEDPIAIHYKEVQKRQMDCADANRRKYSDLGRNEYKTPSPTLALSPENMSRAASRLSTATPRFEVATPAEIMEAEPESPIAAFIPV